MARDSSRPQKTAANGPSIESGAAFTAVAMAAAPQHDAVTMKEVLTAPFMIYDTQSRRIVPNPSYNRALLMELRRLQSIAVTKLRTPMQANISYTPKELLYELEAALFCICASAAVTSNEDALQYLMSDAEADAAMPQLESFLAHHNAPAKSTVALAYCLTEGTSHAILTSFISMVQQRVEAELDPAIDRRRTAEEHRALRSTKNNINDIAQLLRDIETTYHSIDTPSQVQRRQPQSDPTQVDVARSPAANAVPAQMIDAAFYKVLRWVMAVDTDRRALKVAAVVAAGHGGSVGEQRQQLKGTSAVAAAVASAVSASGSTSSAPAAVAAASTQGFAKVADYDPFTGQVTLERAGESQRWGLLLNAKGLLVGLENELRNSSEAGERLYDAVQQQSGEAGGLAIYEVNRRRIRPVHLTDDALEASRAEILQRLQKGLTQPIKALHLSIEKRKQADLTAPHEVLYEVSYQGAENCVGQRCLLMLERASTSISWGLKLKYLKGSPAVLSDFSPNMRLSAAAKNFLFDTRGRVRVLKMNSKDVSRLTAAEMKELVSGTLILTLNLQVTDSNGQVPEGTVDATEEEEPPQVTAAVDDADEAEVEAAAPEVEEDEKGERDAVVGVEVDEAMPIEAKAALSAAAATEVSPMEQADLDDIAAAIADEFLLQQHLPTDAASDKEAEAAAMKKRSDALPKGGVDAVEGEGTFEELDWAKPTSTFGAPGEDEDGHDHGAEAKMLPHDKDAEGHAAPRVEEDDAGGAADVAEYATERALLKKFHLLPHSGSGGEVHVEEGADAEAEGQQLAHEEEAGAVGGEGDDVGLEAAADDGLANDGARAVEEEDGARALEEDAPAKKTRKGRKAKGEREGGKRKTKEEREKKARGRKKKTAAAAKEDAEHDDHAADAEEEEANADGAAAVQAAVDVPLVNLPPTAAEVAIEEGRKNAARVKRGRRSTTTDVEAGGDADTEKLRVENADLKEHTEDGQEPVSSAEHKESAKSVAADDDISSSSRVSLSELMSAAPLTFENDVKLERFDGSTLELGRTSVASPWNIKVAFAGDEIIMTKLPPMPTAQRQHPFLRALGAGAQGEVKWLVERLNGQDLSMMSKSLKTKALDAIKGSTQLTFVLKALRK